MACPGLGSTTPVITNSAGSGSRQFTGVVSGGAGVGITFAGGGAGQFYLGNQGNTFSGPLKISGGEVVVNDDGALGGATSLTLDGGRLTLGVMDSAGAVTALTAGSISATRNIYLGSSANTSIAVQGATGVVTYNGVLADVTGSTGSFAKAGGGTLVLGGASTYSGIATINNGTIRLAVADERLPATTVVALGQAASNNTGTLDLNGFNQTLAGLVSIAGSGSFSATNVVTSATAATLTLNGSGSYVYGANSTTNNGVLSGALNVVKAGSGSQTLGGNNTYSGGTTVAGGTLVVTGTVARPRMAEERKGPPSRLVLTTRPASVPGATTFTVTGEPQLFSATNTLSGIFLANSADIDNIFVKALNLNNTGRSGINSVNNRTLSNVDGFGKITSTISAFAQPVAAPVPEPSTLAMLGLGLAGIAAVGSTRRRVQP